MYVYHAFFWGGDSFLQVLRKSGKSHELHCIHPSYLPSIEICYRTEAWPAFAYIYYAFFVIYIYI
jgi:hypothetical protein